MTEVTLFTSKEEMYRKLKERDIIQVIIGGQKFNLTRVDDRVILFEQKCPHFEYPLVQAKVNPFGVLVCPWHNYKFELTRGEESENKCRALWLRKAIWNDQSECTIKI